MKLVVVSDSHGDNQILDQLTRHYRDEVAAFIHCGDSELNDSDSLLKRFLIVRGNMDFSQALPLSITAKIMDEPIFIAHGHRLGVNFNLSEFSLAAHEASAKLAFYGHTHQLACEMVADCLLLNPGSISEPRGKWAKIGGTYAVVEINKQQILVQYYNRKFEPIPELRFKFDRSK